MTRLRDDRKVTTEPLEPQELAHFICGKLDALMTTHGFQTGQAGIGADVGIIYCTPYQEFRRRFPHLAPTIDYDDEGACTDLNIYASTGPHARLYGIRFDGVSLGELLADESTDFAGEAETISELPAPEGTIHLRMTLERLFARHAVA